MMSFNYGSSQITDGDLNEVEMRFGFRFPEGFRRLYLYSNGGRPIKNVFVDNSGPCVVDAFLPIKDPGQIRTTLDTCVQWLKIDQQAIPAHLVPFADDSFGNFYCFSIREKDFGAIYWLKMEGKRKVGGDFLAASLDEFLERLKSRAEAAI